MSEHLPPDLLARLCEDLGVDRVYWDIWGQQHHASIATQAAILSSLGLDTSTTNRLRHSAAALSSARWTRGLPPVLVIIALIAGGELAGFLGAVLAVPLAAAALEFLNDLDRGKRASRPRLPLD